MYAVIKTGGKQYKVSKDDIISVEKLSEEAGKKIKLNEVLIISDKGKPVVGDPLIKGASVEAEIVDHTRSAKITVFKKKRRHNYRRKQGHKQNITNLKILSINSSKGKAKSSDEEKTAPKKQLRKKQLRKKQLRKRQPRKKQPQNQKKVKTNQKKLIKRLNRNQKKLIKVRRSKIWLTRKQADHQETEEIQLEEGLVLKNMVGRMLSLGILSYAKGAQSGSQVKMLALEKITQSFL